MKIQTLKANSKQGFHLLAGINREIKPAHVSEMAESIQLMGVIRPVVVATISHLPGGKKLYIIDGQHLYTACLRLKIDTPYVELSTETVDTLPKLIETIALLNSTSKTWVLEDYINTWSYYKSEYQTFKDLFNRYNVERGTLAELLHTGVVQSNSNMGGNSKMSKTLKNGELRILNLKKAIEVLDYVADLRSITKDLGRIEQKLIISTIIEKIKADGGSYDHKKYKAYLQSKKIELKLASNDVNTIRRLVNV